MTGSSNFVTQINGVAPGIEDLVPLAFAGFAHFTAMQVRDGRVRGLDLHLARLRNASMRFFGRAMPDEVVRNHLRKAIACSPSDLSLTATMFSRTGEFTPFGDDRDPSLLVRTAPAATGPVGPLRLAAIRNERPLAEIKHTGEAIKTLYLRQAVNDGYDDAAFIDSAGCLSEATIWNLAFWDGKAIIWPKASILPGVTMSIVRRQLEKLVVPQEEKAISLDDMGELSGAAVMNSWTPGVGISAIGSVEIAHSSELLRMLHRAYRHEPMEPV